MKVILIENTMIDGKRRVAGEEVDLPEAEAKRFCSLKLARQKKEVPAQNGDSKKDAPENKDKNNPEDKAGESKKGNK